MSWRRLVLAAFLLLVFSLAPTWAPAEDGDTTAYPEILSPKDGAKAPREGEDPPCPPEGPCSEIYVKGRVPKGLWPFIAVGPLRESRRVWIQPAVNFVKRDGTFEGRAFLGGGKQGRGERFQVIICAHVDKKRLREGQVLPVLPEDCKLSDPITVLRTR